MSKRRIKFSKLNMAKYISHLDLLRCFTRSISRSGLPIEYSEGFNPHQKMAFALPLPVGVTSVCEFVDISLTDGVCTDEEIMERLNLNLPPDIRVLKVGDADIKPATIASAKYLIMLPCGEKLTQEMISKFFAQSEVVVMKKTKKGKEKPINILEYVRSWEIKEVDEQTLLLDVILDAGGERNLKPDVLIDRLADMYPSIDKYGAEIMRECIFAKPDANSDKYELFE